MFLFIENLLVNIGIMIILAVSLNLINGITGMLSLGHYAFFGIGAYAGAYFTTLMHTWGIVQVLPEPLKWVLFIVIIFIGGLIASLLGLLIGAPTLRLRGDYLAIATLGFNEIFKIVVQNLDFLGGPKGYNITEKLPGALKYHTPLFKTNLIWILIFVIFTIFVVYRIMKSYYGRNLLSIREDEIAAEAMGIKVSKYKIFAFLVGSFLAGLAGVLFVMYDRFYINPSDFGFDLGIPILLMIVLGGLGSMSGAVLGAVLLTVVQEILKMIPGISSQYFLVYALLLIVIMVVRPQGLLGRKEISDLYYVKHFGDLFKFSKGKGGIR